MNTALLQYYEAIEQASADMLLAARSGDWDQVVKLEGACAVLISVGLVFQLPVALLALVRFRVLSHATLAGNRKVAYVALMALAVLMPGVDPVTTLMWVVPLGVMFEVSVLLARRTERRAAKRAAADRT